MFLTRKFPPSVGGIEVYCSRVAAFLRATTKPTIIALGRSKPHLIWFFPYAALRLAVWLLRRRKGTVIFGDALTYVILAPFLRLGSPRTVVFTYGVDLTFKNRTYQWLLRRRLSSADLVAACSKPTACEAVLRGAREESVTVVHPGMDVPPSTGEQGRAVSRAEVCRRIGLPDSAFILVSVGRLAPRKGLAWFIKNVIPKLPEHVVYLVAGSGPEEPTVSRAIAQAGVDEKVRVLGYVDDDMRQLLVAGTDLFVMPNVPIPGGFEGFGLVVIEATLLATPVVASSLEGIRDAVIDGVTGYLCEPANAGEFVSRITSATRDTGALRSDARRFQSEAMGRFSLDRFERDLHTLLRIP